MKFRLAAWNTILALLLVSTVWLQAQVKGAEKAPAFEATNTTGPSFVSDATSGPPLQIKSPAQVNNLNVDFLNGLHASAFARLTSSNTFSANQTVNGSVTASSFVGNGSALTGIQADTPNSRSFLSSDYPIAPTSNQQSSLPIDWSVVQYDTLGAIQQGPWRYVAPTTGKYRVSTFIRYRPNGPIAAGQIVQVEVFVNGTFDYGALGGFQALNDSSGAELFIQGEDEVAAHAGDQITINVFQNTAQTGSVTTASHVLVSRTGN